MEQDETALRKRNVVEELVNIAATFLQGITRGMQERGLPPPARAMILRSISRQAAAAAERLEAELNKELEAQLPPMGPNREGK